MWIQLALRLVLDGDLAEQESARLAARTDADSQYERHVLADVGEVDRETSQHWRVVPDMVEGEAGELATPAQSHRDSTQQGQDLVAAVERPCEAHVATAPDTVE